MPIDNHQRINSVYEKNARLVMKSIRSSSISDFQKLELKGILKGKWEDIVWHATGHKLVFAKPKNPFQPINSRRTSELKAFHEAKETVIKSLITDQLMNGNRTSSLSQTMMAFRVLETYIDDNIEAWVNLNRAPFNKALSRFEEAYTNEFTLHHKISRLRQIKNHVNNIKIFHNGKSLRLLRKPISWNPNTKNPSHRIYDVTTNEYKRNSENKYPKDLAIAIAKLKRELAENPMIDPKPGCYSIRVSALLPCIALGLRIGEVTSLPTDALGFDDRTDTYFLKVWTEKTDKPVPRPISELWQPIFKSEFAEILNSCSSARKRAKLIEQKGFGFVKQQIVSHREKRPLDHHTSHALKYLSLTQDMIATVQEVVDLFNLSPKQFGTEGLYSTITIQVPSLTAIRVINWVEDRFKSDDWINYFHIARKGKNNGNYHIARRTINNLSGNAPGNASNIYWLKDALDELYKAFDKAGLFKHKQKSNILFTRESINSIRSAWEKIKRNTILKNAKFKAQIVLIDDFTQLLEARYEKLLSKHYEEFVSYDSPDNHRINGNNYSVNQRLSEHLFVVWDYQFDTVNASNGMLPRPLTRADIYSLISEKSQKKTIFQRLDIKDEEGKHYSFHPHQIRHWVTTAMIRSGYNEKIVDLIMGRSPGQTRHYDHRSGTERAQAIRDRGIYSSSTPPNDWLGSKVRFLRDEGYSASEIEAFIAKKLQILNFSPWGGCSRDLTVMPCSKGLSCLRGFGDDSVCKHFHIDPFDLAAKKEIERLLLQHQQLLNSLEPNAERLRQLFNQEFDESSAIDQHLMYVIDVIKGCQHALAQFP